MSHSTTIERAMTYLLTWKVFLCNQERPCSWIVDETKHWMRVSLTLSCFVHSPLPSTSRRYKMVNCRESEAPQQPTAQSISFLNVQPLGERLHLDMDILVI
jgi:hypothetical protein